MNDRMIFIFFKVNQCPIYFSLEFILIFKIVILRQSFAVIFINKTVPADLEDCASRAEYKDKDGQEIHAAAKNGNIKIIGLLLSQEFEVDSRDEECSTPLREYTALNGHEDAFQMLINGSDPSLKHNKDSVCSTALHKVEIHPLSTSCYHLVSTLVQGIIRWCHSTNDCT